MEAETRDDAVIISTKVGGFGVRRIWWMEVLLISLSLMHIERLKDCLGIYYYYYYILQLSSSN